MHVRPYFILSIILAGLISGVSAVGAAQAAGAPSSSQMPRGAAAVVDGQVISGSELQDAVEASMFALKSQEYTLERQALDDRIDHILLEREAARQGLTVEQLTRKEIEGRIRKATEDQIRAVYESSKEQYKDKTEAEAFQQIQENLQRARLDLRRRELVKELREKAQIQVFLDPPRVSVATDGTRSTGPKNAPITIVEFADFQCPYCSRSAATLRELRQKYGDQLRLVFRDFPLSIHASAPKAAEAASCADSQGKFWEMHDKLYANQANLAVADIKRYAAQIGLREDQFNRCLDSGEFGKKWQEDRQDGQRYGISGTPTFFINGRMLVGAVRYEAFAQMIDEEIERTKSSQGASRLAVTAPSGVQGGPRAGQGKD